MLRLFLILLLLVIAYIAAGEAVYLKDVVQEWCGTEFSPEGMGWSALVWPLRLLNGDIFCD